MRFLRHRITRIILIFMLAGVVPRQYSLAVAASQIVPADHWEQVTTLPADSIGAIAIDPADADRLYIGVSDAEKSAIYCSDNAGVSWSNVSFGLSGNGITCIAVNPENSSVLYAASRNNVFRSTDYGFHWAQSSHGLPGNFVTDLMIDPAAPTVVYAATDGEQGIWRSTDSGAHWSSVSRETGNSGVTALTIDASSTVYAANPIGVFRSVDQGTHWTNVGQTGLNYISCLAADPAEPSTLFAGTAVPPGDGYVFRSTDQGKHWSIVSAGLPSIPINSLVMSRDDPAVLYAATSAGVFRSDDKGDHWVSASTGLLDQTNLGPNVQRLALGTGTQAILYATSNFGHLFRRAAVMTPFTTVTLDLLLNDTRMNIAKMDGSRTAATLEVAPLLDTGNRVFVPVRAIAEAMGWTVDWNASAHMVTIQTGRNRMRLTIGKHMAELNGFDIPIDTDPAVMPHIVAGRILLPLRFAAESLGAKTEYSQISGKISITYSVF